MAKNSLKRIVGALVIVSLLGCVMVYKSVGTKIKTDRELTGQKKGPE